MLETLIITPILAIIAILPIKDSSTYKDNKKFNQIGLIFTCLNFVFSLLLIYNFDSQSLEYQFTKEFNQSNYCHFYIGIDGISLYFVLITTFIIPICLLSN